MCFRHRILGCHESGVRLNVFIVFYSIVFNVTRRSLLREQAKIRIFVINRLFVCLIVCYVLATSLLIKKLWRWSDATWSTGRLKTCRGIEEKARHDARNVTCNIFSIDAPDHGEIMKNMNCSVLTAFSNDIKNVCSEQNSKIDIIPNVHRYTYIYIYIYNKRF